LERDEIAQFLQNNWIKLRQKLKYITKLKMRRWHLTY